MNLDINVLEKLADAATPGPWEVGCLLDGEDCVRTDRFISTCVVSIPALHEHQKQNHAFIAAANPQTIKQLITRQRELEALCKLQHRALSEVVGTTHEVDDALAAYKQIIGER